MKNTRFIGATVILIFLLIFSIRGTVVSQTNEDEVSKNSYLNELERDYITTIKGLMDEKPSCII